MVNLYPFRTHFDRVRWRQNQRNHSSQSKDRKILQGANKKPKKKNSKQPEKWESAYDQVTIGYSFASDWLVIWVELSTPITEHQAKKKPYVISDYFDTHLKNTLPSLLPSDYLFVSCSLWQYSFFCPTWRTGFRRFQISFLITTRW